MWKDSLCHYHAGYVNMECLQGSHSVPNLSFPCLYYSSLISQLSGSLCETIVDTFWWTITSSTPAPQESAGFRPVQMESCTSWDYNLQFFISCRVAFSPPCGVRNNVMQNNGIGIQVLATDEHLKKLIGPKRILCWAVRILGISFSP